MEGKDFTHNGGQLGSNIFKPTTDSTVISFTSATAVDSIKLNHSCLCVRRQIQILKLFSDSKSSQDEYDSIVSEKEPN